MFNDLNKVCLFIGTTSDLFTPDLISFLSKKEQIQASSYTKTEDRRTYITWRYFLKKLLSDFLNIEISEIQFTYGTNGKPYLKNKPIHFSVSHSQGVFILAITSLGLVGVDIERKDRKMDHKKLEDLILSEKEKEDFQLIPNQDKHEVFINCWTQKEAFFKAYGSGISSNIKDFQVTIGVDSKPRIITIKWSEQEKKAWSLIRLNSFENYFGTLAVKTNGVKPLVEQITLTHSLNLELTTA